MSAGRTVDWVHFDSASGSPAWIDYRRGAGLAEHSITRGRDASERVEHVIAFAGQSLTGPAGSTPFLVLSDSAFDITRNKPPRSAFGRAQGVAFRLRRGRVVALGVAAMLTAQVTKHGTLHFGMQHDGTDDRQLALNIGVLE